MRFPKDPLEILSVLSNLLPPGLALIRWQQLDRPQRLIGGLIGFLILTEIASYVYFAPVVRNNVYLFHLYTIVEFAVICTAYRTVFSSAALREFLRVIVPAFAVMALVNAIWWQPARLAAFNSIPRSVEALILIALALLYLRQLLDELVVKRLSRHPMFWVTVGVLFYFSGTFFLFAAIKVFDTSLAPSLVDRLWELNYVANIVFNLFLTVALWLPSNPPPPHPTPIPS